MVKLDHIFEITDQKKKTVGVCISNHIHDTVLIYTHESPIFQICTYFLKKKTFGINNTEPKFVSLSQRIFITP
jgi:hypothetical protein